MKTIGDAIVLRNRSIRMLEEADLTSLQERVPLLTWVITGGGLAGVEVTAHLVDFLQAAIKAYPTIRPGDVRVVLVDALPRLMPELSPKLADFALRKLQERGVEVHLNATVESATPESVTIKGVGTIPTQNLVWTAGVAPTPSVQTFGIPLQRHRIPTDQCLRVPGHPNVWALGDVARIPDGSGSFHPPTAQYAVREGRHVAKNVLAVAQGREPVPFRYRTLGMMASLGRRTGVAEILGRFMVSGLPAWLMWRTYYPTGRSER
jgi:NADH:quinone reductase (non-electrogenic)